MLKVKKFSFTVVNTLRAIILPTIEPSIKSP